VLGTVADDIDGRYQCPAHAVDVLEESTLYLLKVYRRGAIHLRRPVATDCNRFSSGFQIFLN
jgi:hypothetical protein